MSLVCPNCLGALTRPDGDGAGALACPACRATWPVVDGIPRFMDVDPKYDTPPVTWDVGGPPWKLPFVDAGITWWFHKHLPPGGLVLDVGCGVGLRYVASRSAAVHGIDSSAARLAHARTIYREVSVANVLSIPYPDDTFDAAISVDVLEHIPAAVKDRALREMIRVVKPGGRLVHVLDLDAQKPLHRWAARRPDLWQRYFIDQMGHYGLETASRAKARFRALGLEPIAVEPTNRTILQHPANYAWQFDNEYRHLSRWVRLLTSLSYIVRRHPALLAAYSGFYQLVWTRTLERLFPEDWAFNLQVAYRVTDASKQAARREGRPSGGPHAP